MQKELLKGRAEMTRDQPEQEAPQNQQNEQLPPSFAIPSPVKRLQESDFDPLPWHDYFETSNDLAIPSSNDIFRVYQTRTNNTQNNSHPPLFVFHHGGGFSALTFALTIKHMKEVDLKKEFSALCFDCRGHGATKTEDDTDLSLVRMSQDLVNVVNAAYPELPNEIVLIGHSMGGAVVVDVASRGLVKGVIGAVVLDIVEGTALESLGYILRTLRDRPTHFATIRKAIEWSVRHGGSKNMEASRISIPSQLVPLKRGDDADGLTDYQWRTDLAATQPFWQGWYEGMSAKFLSMRGSRLIVLAGTDRLDKTLTIGQMQGKFQMIVLNEVGHSIQEDAPDRLARILLEFYERNRPGVGIKRFPIPPKPDTRIDASKA